MNADSEPSVADNSIEEYHRIFDLIEGAYQSRRKLAGTVLKQLESVLRDREIDERCIVFHELWSMAYALTDSPVRAIEHRQKQIELVEELFAIDAPIVFPNPAYSADKLAGAYRSLAESFEENGNNVEAQHARQRAKNLLNLGD